MAPVAGASAESVTMMGAWFRTSDLSRVKRDLSCEMRYVSNGTRRRSRMHGSVTTTVEQTKSTMSTLLTFSTYERTVGSELKGGSR